jgi:hypothetical protein
VTRRVEHWGTSRTAAQQALQEELRGRRGERTGMLKSNSRFRQAADIWMGTIKERRADSTADAYASCVKNQVLPQLGELRLVEWDVAHLDAFFSWLERARRVAAQDDGTTVEKVRHSTRRMIRHFAVDPRGGLSGPQSVISRHNADQPQTDER